MVELAQSPTVIVGLVFAAVALAIYVLANLLIRQQDLRRRYEAAAVGAGLDETLAPRRPRLLPTIDPGVIGLSADAQKKLRQDLLRAGFFSPGAIGVFATVQAISTVAFPLITYMFVSTQLPATSPVLKFALVAGGFLLGFYMPRGYVARRVRLSEEKYRLAFPDLLDLLVVCVNAGLSLEAALERVGRELDEDQRELKWHLGLMLAEMRAGRSTVDALRGFADRLGIEETGNFVTLLHQSIELGADISAALTVFSDEMRDRRMSRAEQKAYSLPVKLSIPLTLFIFPTLLLVIMTPVVLRVLETVREML